MILNSLIRSLLEKELESVAIRLNKRAPDVYFKVNYMYMCAFGSLLFGNELVSSS